MKISIILEALTGTFETDMKRASKAAERAAKQVQEDWKKVGIVIGGAIATSVTALAALTRSSINAADNLAKMAQKVGVSVEVLSTLGYAADQSGIGIDALQGGLVKLAKNASDAAQGTGSAVNAFDALGISVTNADGSLKDTDVLLREVATQFARYEDGANKTALAVGVFGRAGAELVLLLNEGASGIAELEARARDLGLEIGGNTAKQAEVFNGLLSDLGNLATGLGNDIATELLPYLNSLTEEMVDSGIETRKASGAAEVLATTFEALATVAIVIKNGIEQLTIATAAFVDTATAVGKFANDLNPITQAWRALNGEVKPFGASLEELSGTLSAVADSAQTGFVDSFMDGARAVKAFLAPIEKANDGIKKTGAAAKGAAPGIRDMAKEQKALEKALKESDKEWSDYEKIIADVADEHEQIAQAYADLQQYMDAQVQSLANMTMLIGLDSDARDRAIVAMQAEEEMLRAIETARERGATVTEEDARARIEAARATALQTLEAEKLVSILSRFEDVGLDGLVSDLELVNAALERGADAFGNAFKPEQVAAMQAAVVGLNQQIGVEMQAALEDNVSAMQQGFRSLQSMTEEGSSAYKAMEVAIQAANVVQAIGAVLNQGNGDPYTAFARMAAMAAAVAGLVGSIVSFSANGPSSSGAAARQAAQGTGTVLGDSEAQSESIVNALEITADATSELVGISRGMLNALQSMQRGIGAASGSLARTGFAGLDLAEGAGRAGGLFDPLGIGGGTFASRAISAIFGGGQELIDQGLLIRGGAFGSVSRDPRASTYQTIEEEGGWFSSDQISDELEALGDDATTQIRLILMSIGDTVREAARALGLDAEEFNAAIAAFEVEAIRISTMDLTGEEASQALEAEFSRIFDNLAGAVVPFIDQFQRVGEGLGETLVRVATSVQVTEEAIYQLGLSLADLEPETMAQVSVALIEAVGSIDAFIAGMQAFVSNFAPEAHRFAVAQDEITRAFGQAGLTIPETRDGMWQLMQSLDATTESGREQIATLLRLAGVADVYYDALEQQAESAADAARQAADAAADAAAQDASARALLIGIAGERAYAGLNSAARAIADVNARFSELRIALNATNPTLEEAGELERARTQAIEDATAALMAQGRDLIEGLVFEESLEGMTEVQAEVANINREFDAYVVTLLDLGFALDSTEVATLEAIRAARIMRVETAELAEVMTVSFGEMRSAVAIFIQDLRTQFEHLMDPGFRDWIEGLAGITMSVDSGMITRAGVLDEVAQSYAGGIASLSTQLAAAQAELDAMGGVGGGPERSALIGKINNLRQLLGDVSGALGEALDYANQLFEQQIGEMLEGLAGEFGSQDPFDLINARFDDMIEQATAWGASLTQLAEIEAYRILALQQAEEEAFQQEMEWLRQLAGLRDSLLLDPQLSTLTPAEMLAEAQRQYEEALAGSMAGDENARALFDSATREFLEQARDFYASSDAYQAIFGRVQGDIGALIAASPVTLASEISQQESAAAAVTELQGLREDGDDQTDAMVGAIAELKAEALASREIQAQIVIELRRLSQQPRVGA